MRIIVGDCRDVLRTLPEASFDACITDPPYGETSLDWDRRVQGWLPEVARVLKPACSLWIFGSFKFLVALTNECENAGFTYAQEIIWEKHNGSGFLNDRFRRVHEFALHFYRGPWRDIYKNPQFTNDATARSVRKKAKPAHWHGATGSTTYTSEDGGPRLMRSVLQVRSEHGRAIHPTQKPLEILLPIIRYSVPPGGSVIDPFAGSASTLIAARMEGISGLGIELSPERAEKARLRIAGDAPLLAEVHAA